jgi:Photosynthetic reaction centre cytochrome C subunit
VIFRATPIRARKPPQDDRVASADRAVFSGHVGVYPRGYHDVDCSTCHRGKASVETKAAQHFQNRGDAAGRIPANEKATSLKVLPPDTDVHGKGSIMEEFRDALLVDCAYCHEGPNWATEENPRKELARQMILMTRSINAQLAAQQAVTCYSCHRGAIHPLSLSNQNYDPSAERK